MNQSFVCTIRKSLAGIQKMNVPVNELFIKPPKPVYFAAPCSSFGYYRGLVVYGQDMANREVAYGPDCGGIGEYSQGTGPVKTDSGISANVLFFGLVAMLGFMLACFW